MTGHNRHASPRQYEVQQLSNFVKRKGMPEVAAHQVCPIHVIKDGEHYKARHDVPVQFSGNSLFRLLFILQCAQT